MRVHFSWVWNTNINQGHPKEVLQSFKIRKCFFLLVILPVSESAQYNLVMELLAYFYLLPNVRKYLTCNVGFYDFLILIYTIFFLCFLLFLGGHRVLPSLVSLKVPPGDPAGFCWCSLWCRKVTSHCHCLQAVLLGGTWSRGSSWMSALWPFLACVLWHLEGWHLIPGE